MELFAKILFPRKFHYLIIHSTTREIASLTICDSDVGTWIVERNFLLARPCVRGVPIL